MNLKPILLIVIFFAYLQANKAHGQKLIKYYVSQTGKDTENDGSIGSPYKSLKKAQSAVRARADKETDVKVIIRKGVYQLNEPLSFAKADGGDSLHSIEYSSYENESVTISGGKPLKGNWERTGQGEIWKLKIPAFSKDRDAFRSLFLNGKRLTRATSDTLFSKGPVPKYASLYKVFDFPAIRRLAKDSIEVFCSFVYENSDLDNVKDLANAEAIVYNSWEASWHSVRQVNSAEKIISFKNPATYPVGFFNPRVRYRIENSKDYLDQSGEWLLDYQSGEVFYYARKGEDPNMLTFIVPKLSKLIIINGGKEANTAVRNVKFTGINFAYSTSAWGVNSIPENFKAEGRKRYNWVEFKEGFSSIQAALDCGEAIILKNAQNVTFDKCSFTNLGNYAIRIGEYSMNNKITNSKVSNIGGGGIVIGINSLGGKEKKFPSRLLPSYNSIENCDISECGAIFPSGVGIGIMQANHSMIKSNKIYDLPYSGISVGWSFSTAESYTTDNTVTDNYIHDVMKILADGGGIYTLGRQTGSVYKNNYIKNVFRSTNAIGATNNGFFFDEGSSDFTVDNNVVENIQSKDYRFNKSDQSKIKLGKNHFQKTESNSDLKDRAVRQWKNSDR